jgi:hypothetical protein
MLEDASRITAPLRTADGVAEEIDRPGVPSSVERGLGVARTEPVDRARALLAARVPLMQQQLEAYQRMGVNPLSRSGRP